MLHSQYAAERLAERRIKLILIVRDPRAVALSHAEWLVNEKTNYRSFMTPLSLQERLNCEVFGLPSGTLGVPPLIPLIYRFRNMRPWKSYPYLLVTSFEQLAGERAGGSSDAQITEIERIRTFIGTGEIDVTQVQNDLWGVSTNFRHGVIDRWTTYAADCPRDISHQIDEMLDIYESLLA